MQTVLLIDDDLGTLETFSMALSLSNYDVVTADTGLQGFRAAMRGRPSLVIVDLRLPDMSGLDVLRRLRDEGETVPFILVTAFPSTESIVEAMRLGAVDCVEKPLPIDRLVSLVDNAIRPARTISEDVSEVVAEAHALKRWAEAIVAVLNSKTDPKTLRAWGRRAAASPGTLRNWCHTANLPARKSLTFARLLRAVLRFQAHRELPENSLDVVDTRTLSRLLKQCGTDWRLRSPGPTVAEFLARQTLIADDAAIEQVKVLLYAAPTARVHARRATGRARASSTSDSADSDTS
jgi:DNA-binding response OmpR family regulator